MAATPGTGRLAAGTAVSAADVEESVDNSTFVAHSRPGIAQLRGNSAETHLEMMMVRFILVDFTIPVMIRPRMDTLPVKGHFLSTYLPAGGTEGAADQWG